VLDERVPLDDGPAPAPRRPIVIRPPAPTPAAVPAPALPRWVLALLIAFGVLTAGSLGLLAYRSFEGTGAARPAATLKASGKANAKAMVASVAASLKAAAADARDPSKPWPEVKESHLKRVRAAIEGDFDQRFYDRLNAIIPDGTDQPTPEQRGRFADALDEIAAGQAEAVR
jgi:hypothetical protein